MTWAMDELQSRAATQLGRLQDFSDDLARIRIRETSADDLITAETDGNGALTGLWLGEGANELGGPRLGAAIVATAMLAAQRAFAQRAVLTEEFAESFADLLGTPEDSRYRPSSEGAALADSADAHGIRKGGQ